MKCMTVGLLLLSTVLVGADMKGTNIKPADSKNDADLPEAQWFEQCLDHFDILNTNTWKQRYYVRDRLYKQGGPAFLIIEGEIELYPETIDFYATSEYTISLNGLVFSLEHRFYGQSRPVSDLNIATLQYLAIEQALADIASFIAGMNLQYELPQDTRWILLGGSYAGNLAAWARAKYPHLVYASVAYSAPVQAKLNFWEYKDHVQRVIKAFNPDCLEHVKQGQAQLTKAVSKSDNLDDLKKKFRLCDDIDNSNHQDVVSLLGSVGITFSSIVRNKNNWKITLNDACDIMANKTLGDYIDRYAEVSSIILDAKGKECLDFSYIKYINDVKNLSWESEISDGDIQWDYQTCTQFGLFQTSYLKTHLFSDTIPLDFYIRQCMDLFGKKFTEKYIGDGVDRTNQVYGGTGAKTTRVIYINGEEDPWMTLGITRSTIPESPAILVRGEAHVVCLARISDSASKEVKTACKQVEELIRKWCTD